MYESDENIGADENEMFESDEEDTIQVTAPTASCSIFTTAEKAKAMIQFSE
jgi:hypothetical protein